MSRLTRRQQKPVVIAAHPIPRNKRKHYSRSSVQLPKRLGVFFRRIGRHLRAVYQQFDGSIEFADVCKCSLDWEPFRVRPRMDCEIDEHKLLARREQEAA